MTPTSTPTAKDSLIQTFFAYSRTFEDIVKNDDAKPIVKFIYTPAILMDRGTPTYLLAAEADVIQAFSSLIAQLKEAGFHHSKLNSYSATILDEANGVGLISGTATRYKDAAESEILETFGFTYTLKKTDAGWKIIFGIIHDTATAIAFA